jgi:RNA polymerase sigma factor (sigma-70 family)
MSTFNDVYDHYGDQIYRICRGYLYDPKHVDDLFQDVMTNIWQGLDQFRGEAKLSTWIYRVTVNTAITYNRQIKRDRDRHSEYDETSPEEQRMHSDSTADSYSMSEYRALHRCIHQLPDQDRLIISLVLEELSYKQIADIVGISVNYVGVKISRIKAKLGKCIPHQTKQQEEAHYE